jgi:fibronectin-binding autotransporter adhesin
MLLTLLNAGSLATTGSATVDLSGVALSRPQKYDGSPQGNLAGAAFAAAPFGGLVVNTTVPQSSLSFASTASGSVTLTGAANVSLSFATTGSGSLTLTGAANDALSFASTGSGTVDLLGAATDVLKFATTGSGSLTLTGNANSGSSSPTTGSGSISLSAAASASLTVVLPTTGSGSLSLSASANDVLKFATTGGGSLTLSASATDTFTPLLPTTGSGSLTLSGALAGATVALPTKVQTSALKPAIGGSIYQFNAAADAVGKTVSLYAGSTLLLTSAPHRSGTFTNMQLTLRWDSTAILVLSSSGTVLVWHDLSATERADLISGITVGSWTGTGITPGTSVLGSWSYRLSAYMKKSIGHSPRLWSVWATYPAGLDFILNETTGAAYFQDGTDQDEYANPNLTVLRGGFAYDLATTFAARVANAGGTEFLSTSPADATGILADPYTGANATSGSASVSLSGSASVSLGSGGVSSTVGQPAQTFAGSTFAGTTAGIGTPASGGTTSYPTTGSASVDLSAIASTSSATVIIGPLTFAGRTLAGAVL